MIRHEKFTSSWDRHCRSSLSCHIRMRVLKANLGDPRRNASIHSTPLPPVIEDLGTVDSFPRVAHTLSFNKKPFTLEELNDCIKTLSKHKAPGHDTLPVEAFSTAQAQALLLPVRIGIPSDSPSSLLCSLSQQQQAKSFLWPGCRQ